MTFVTGCNFRKQKNSFKKTQNPKWQNSGCLRFFQKRTPAKHSNVLRENFFSYGVFVSNDRDYLTKALVRCVGEQ